MAWSKICSVQSRGQYIGAGKRRKKSTGREARLLVCKEAGSHRDGEERAEDHSLEDREGKVT